MATKFFEVSPTCFLKDAPLPLHEGRACKPGLIILNQPIADIEVLRRLWKHTSFHLCADGGANRLHDLFDSQPELRSRFLPTIIHGDLDSLRSDVKHYYNDHGVMISRDGDQYSTDFGKAIKILLNQDSSVHDILVLGTIAGRLDQGIGLLGELYREQNSENRDGLRFWLFSESNISFILEKGKTVIHTPLNEGLITENVGILPVYGPARVTTSGLEWDVEDWPTQMGGQMSTSNHIKRDQIVIETDAEVLFTMERNADVAG